VITRWLFFIGASLVTGLALLLALITLWPSRSEISSANSKNEKDPAEPVALDPQRFLHRGAIVAIIGAIVAAVATLSEPFLQTKYPPPGASTPTLSDAFNGQPNSWLMRLGTMTAALILVLIAFALRKKLIGVRLALVAGLLSLVSVVGLSLTSHASARQDWRVAAIVVDAIHQMSISLWFGGLVMLALCWRLVTRPLIRRFSTVALPLMVIGVGAGIGNAAFALPALKSLWDSDYGKVILYKAIILVPVLALATFHRQTLKKIATAANDALKAMRVPLRIEVVLAIAIVLGGSVLALLAPPSIAVTPELTSLDLAHYTTPRTGEDRLKAILSIAPAKPGENTFSVHVTTTDDTPVPDSDIQLVRLSFESLTTGAAQNNIDTTPDGNGNWVLKGTQLSIADWWRITVTIRRAGVEDLSAPFYVIMPDPNINGFDSVPAVESNPDAQAVYERGLANLNSLHRLAYIQQLSSGTGTVVESTLEVNDGTDGSTIANRVTTSTATLITIGDQRWLGQPGQPWQQTGSNPPIPPSQFGEDFAGATQFQMGITEEVNGEQAQVIAFFVPATTTAAAWYVWWVGVDSGHVLREAMVSRVHYMSEEYGNFDGPLVIEPPVNEAGTPVATPGLSFQTLPEPAGTPAP
jgi:putative copper export protein